MRELELRFSSRASILSAMYRVGASGGRALLGTRPGNLHQRKNDWAARWHWRSRHAHASYTPAARSCRTHNADERQPLAWRGRHPFFAKRSFSAALLSMASADSFFSLTSRLLRTSASAVPSERIFPAANN